MTGCEIILLLNSVIELHFGREMPELKSKGFMEQMVESFRKKELIVIGHGTHFDGPSYHALMMHQRVPEPTPFVLKPQEYEILDKFNGVPDLRPWYEIAADKGGSKKRKRFIK